jgi:hypothetical protein
VEELFAACKGKSVDEIERAILASRHADSVADSRMLAAYLKLMSV